MLRAERRDKVNLLCNTHTLMTKGLISSVHNVELDVNMKVYNVVDKCNT